MYNNTIEFLYNTIKRVPQKIALVEKNNKVSFSELFNTAYILFKKLAIYYNFNKPVIVFLPKSISALIAFTGIILSGNIYVPLDISIPEKRIKQIINSIDPFAVISLPAFKDDIIKYINEDKIIYMPNTEKETISIEEKIQECREFTDKIIDLDPCYIIHTSGSTGIPKGVVIPHRGVIDYITWAINTLDVNENEVIGNQAPLYFDNSVLDIYLCWATGAELHLIPEESFSFPVKLIEYLNNNRINFIFFVQSVLISISILKLLKKDSLPYLKKIIFAGEVMPSKHLSYWQQNLPNRIFVNLYGPTEITVDCTYFFIDKIYNPDESIPIGYPCKNSNILILTENNEKAKENENGELCVRGSSLALGYWKNKEKTNEVFTQNPLHENYLDRIYRTGDLVYLNNKRQIIFVGRKDSQFKHSGYRIEAGEIEAATLTIPNIEKCCVLYNRGKKEITLFFESIENLSDLFIKKCLLNILPKYMVPRRIINLAQLPLTANKKVDRKTLEKEYF